MNRWVRMSGLFLKTVLPIATVAICIAAARWLILTRPATPQREVAREIPAVEAVTVGSRPAVFSLRSQGQVLPRTATTLAAQVPGRVIAVADAVKNTGFFRAGEVLVKIDPRDYEIRIRRLEASLVAARAKQEETSREFERTEGLRRRNAVSESAFDQARSARDVAQAEVARLEAELDTERNSLADTTITAPFDGCVQQQMVDVGQYVTVGTPLALCFATDAAEIRLPVTDEQFGYLQIPLGKTLAPGTGPAVRLEAGFAGARRSWQGRIVRSEPIVDSKSRMIYLVARVEQPYSEATRSGGQPLAVGMFVDAAIEVPAVSGAFALPEPCVTIDGRLFVLDEQDRLVPRSVRVLHRNAERVVVTGELAAGERVCATRLEQAIAGMPVRVIRDADPAEASAHAAAPVSHQIRTAGVSR